MRSQDAIVVRAADRFVTQSGDVRSRHCFSFGAHYDPANTHFGPLQACNEQTLTPGAGFGSHTRAGGGVSHSERNAGEGENDLPNLVIHGA